MDEIDHYDKARYWLDLAKQHALPRELAMDYLAFAQVHATLCLALRTSPAEVNEFGERTGR